MRTIDGRAGIFGSGWWELDDDQISQILGGELFLHESSKEDSHFAAKVEGVERRDDTGRVELRVCRSSFIKDRAWRGGKPNQNPKHYFKIVSETPNA